MRSLFLVTLMLLLSSCSLFKKDELGPLVKPENKRVEIDRRLLEPCDPEWSILSINATFADTVIKRKEEAAKYVACAIRHKKLVTEVRKSFNIEKD